MQNYKITLRRVLIVMQETTQSVEGTSEEDATLRAISSVEDSAWRTLDSDMVALDTPENLTFQNYKSLEVRNAKEI